jgi:hypothetical protein
MSFLLGLSALVSLPKKRWTLTSRKVSGPASNAARNGLRSKPSNFCVIPGSFTFLASEGENAISPTFSRSWTRSVS